MKVAELIEWLKTLEPDWEVRRVDGDDDEEISHIRVDEGQKLYTLD